MKPKGALENMGDFGGEQSRGGWQVHDSNKPNGRSARSFNGENQGKIAEKNPPGVSNTGLKTTPAKGLDFSWIRLWSHFYPKMLKTSRAIS